MSFNAFWNSFQSRSIHRRSDRRQEVLRPRFESFEDRRMLSFTPVGPFDTGGSGFFDVVTADFNNDGHLDLAGAQAWDNNASVLLGDGQGGFAEALQFEIGDFPSSVAVGDFNEDGTLDLAVGNQLSGDVSVLMGHGDGTFEPAEPLPTPGNPRSVAVGDFNADGKLDLGVASYGYGLFYYGYATVHAGDGEGHFAAPQTTITWFAYFDAATAADLDRDGADDLVIGNESNGPTIGDVHVFLGDESGYLQPSDVLFINHDPSAYVTDVAVGDLNGDDVADIVAADYYNVVHRINVLLGDGQGGYGPEQGYGGSAYSRSVVLGDFTGDGHIDIANDTANIFRGNGDGTFSELPTGGTNENAITAGDFNGDGWLDVVGLSIWLNNGDWSVDPTRLGDMDLDGDLDFDDIDDFTLGLTDALRYEALHGVAPSTNGDMDRDGDLDFDDIPGFVDRVEGATTSRGAASGTATTTARDESNSSSESASNARRRAKAGMPEATDRSTDGRIAARQPEAVWSGYAGQLGRRRLPKDRGEQT
jgi:hypothetical protein